MALNAELYYHLGKNDLKRVLESGRGNYIMIIRSFCFFLILALYLMMYNAFLLSTYLFKIMLPTTRRVYQDYFAAGFWTLCVYILELNGVKVVILGDHLEDENALIISNHVSLVDYIIFPYLTRRALDDTVNKVIKHEGSEIKEVEIDVAKEKEREREKTNNNKKNKKIIEKEQVIFAKDLSSMLIPKLNFFTWFNIWNVPSIEYFKNISQADENWELDGETLNVVFKKLINSCDYTQWLAMFPEVNIFTEKDSKLQHIMGEKYYLPIFENVLYPRFGGLANAIGGLYKTKFTRLYDITLLYYNKDKFTKKILNFNPPTLLNAFGLKDKNVETVIVIHVAGKFLSRVPLKRNKLEKWLENRWIKKDKLINKLKSEILKVEMGKD